MELLEGAENYNLSLPPNDTTVRRMRDALRECVAAGIELRQRAAQLADDAARLSADDCLWEDALSLRLHGAANLMDVANDYIMNSINSLLSS